jgi:hypothetical protein
LLYPTRSVVLLGVLTMASVQAMPSSAAEADRRPNLFARPVHAEQQDVSTVAMGHPALWATPYKSRRFGEDKAEAIAASPGGSHVYVTGIRDGGPTGDDYATIALDATTGGRLWLSRYDSGGEDGASALGVSPDGTRVYITGTSNDGTAGDDFVTIAYDALTGSVLELAVGAG